MIQKAFIFDTNKCTGCNACQIACILENELDYSSGWRQVVTFNPDHYPELAQFHLSIACNHCADPPCQKYCPALAISKTDRFGTIQIDSGKCIGCKYCSWVCPFDAPDFNHATGVMEKCTFCKDRLEEGREPACVTLCPTGALNTGHFDFSLDQSPVPGFTQTDIKPAIQIVPRRRELKLPQKNPLEFNSDIMEKYRDQQQSEKDKIYPRSEWSLIIFSLLVPLIIATSWAATFTSTQVRPGITLISGIVAMLISITHLGKKHRAYRAILNWRDSWLSREIIFFNLFLFFALIQIFSPEMNRITQWLAAAFGLAALISMDMVYQILPRLDKNKWHSSSVIFTAILLFGLSAQNYALFSAALIIKFILYFQRKYLAGKLKNTNTILRLLTGFFLPPVLWFYQDASILLFILILVMTGETLDRIDFYREVTLVTPQKQMDNDFKKATGRAG